MFTLVIGGAASGKSEYAESWVMRLPGRRIYLATMKPWDEECRARIARHRRLRQDKGFETVERYTNLSGLELPAGTNILLECMSNLTANELYDPEGGGKEAILLGIDALLGRGRHLTIVTNEVFSGGTAYGADTLRYLETLARVNRALASRADTVAEIVCGLPNFLKGGPQP
ncbi:bifunctional adenosylcobinamide kinase/adenosylcobinamide-phosphate guanylyltransferase [uncultured Oscillibacter sp.]|jgi:adenosylcobinamide kinase/adenosylcobinamide-phosphate guanylyltransferase|uniref:bifunctional adenosylcobinamide kinase/adenosylcobinamide-phosphate guanylyltransferase n=1 Tax=uncultured Oscillibacter sp. TaxID=876091 RepID=UPI0025DB2DD1|nr:bifunctional adenosylcobinamide kinase/adenosylcobinamide-phosphate guanylyltransferase [uncultured Oscillibacter sp.]